MSTSSTDRSAASARRTIALATGSRSYAYLLASPAAPLTASAHARAMAVTSPEDALFVRRILTKDGRIWNSLLHPRDRLGRFIRTFSRLLWDPQEGYLSGAERQKRRRGAAAAPFEMDVLAHDSDGTVIARVRNAQPGATAYGQPIADGDIVRVRNEDVEVKTIKGRITRGLKKGLLNGRAAQNFNNTVTLLDRLGLGDMAKRAKTAANLATGRGGQTDPNPTAAIDELRTLGQDLQDEMDRRMSAAGIKPSLDNSVDDIKDPELKRFIQEADRIQENIDSFKHQLGDRTYDVQGRDKPIGGGDTDRRMTLARAQLRQAYEDGKQIIDLSGGPKAVKTVPMDPVADLPSADEPMVDEAEGVLPRLRRGVRQATNQGKRRLTAIGQAWQGSAPGDRFIVGSDGSQIGVGDVVHYPGGSGRGSGSKEPFDGVLVRVHRKKDRNGEFTGRVQGFVRWYNPATGQVEESQINSENLQAGDGPAWERFMTLANSEELAQALSEDKGKNKRFQDALTRARGTAGSILAAPGSKRRSGAGREDQRTESREGELIFRGDIVQTPEGAVARVESISPDGRATLIFPHGQNQPRVSGKQLTKLHTADTSLQDALRANGGGFMPTRQEAVEAMQRLGVGNGPAAAAVADPDADADDIHDAMNTDADFTRAIEESAVPLWERRNRAMERGDNPSAEDQAALQDWDAIISASAGYFRPDRAPAAPEAPAGPPQARDTDPPNPQTPENPQKAVTPDGERIDQQEQGQEQPRPPAPEQDLSLGAQVAEGVRRAKQATMEAKSRGGVRVTDLLPAEFRALDAAVEARDADALIAAVEAIDDRVRRGVVYRNTPLRAVVSEGSRSQGVRLSEWLRQRNEQRPLFDQPQPAATDTAPPTPEASPDVPEGVSPEVDELNQSLAEELLGGGDRQAAVMGFDSGYAVIPAGPDSVESYASAPTTDEIEDFADRQGITVGNSDRALAVWQGEDGSYRLAAVRVTDDKQSAHSEALADGGTGQYIDITDGMVYNAVAPEPGDPSSDSADNDVIDDRSLERGTEPAGDGQARLKGTTKRQQEIIAQAAEAATDPGVRATLEKMATGSGDFTADELAAANDWLRRTKPADIWGTEGTTARQRNGLKASVVNLIKRLSVDSGATGPDPYPSSSTAKRRTREVAQRLSRALDGLDLPEADRASMDSAIQLARRESIENRLANSADVFRSLASAYEALDGADPAVARRVRRHADRLEASQYSVAASPPPPLAQDMASLSPDISHLREYFGDSATGRRATILADQYAEGELMLDDYMSGSALMEMDRLIADNPGWYRGVISRYAKDRIDTMRADGRLGDAADAADMEQLGVWRENASDLLSTIRRAGLTISLNDVGGLRELIDSYDEEERNRLDADLPDEAEASRASADIEQAVREAADAMTPDRAAEMSDEELSTASDRVLQELDEASWDEAVTPEALQQAEDALVDELSDRDSAPSPISDEQRSALTRAEGPIEDMDDAGLESLIETVRQIQSSLPDNVDEDTADRVDAAVDRLTDEAADRMAREAYDDEDEQAPGPEAAPDEGEEPGTADTEAAPELETADEGVVYAELEELAELVTRLDDEDFEPTMQQKRVIAAVQSGKNVVVRAMAGSGKTSTMLAVAKREAISNPQKRLLYIAFNKSVQLEAARKFPANTEVRTANSLAWQAMGKEFTGKTTSERGGKGSGDWMISRPSSVAKAIGLGDEVVVDQDGGDEGLGEALNTRGTVMLINEAVTRFMISDAPEITLDHVRAAEGVRRVALDDQDRQLVLDMARTMWKDFQDPGGRLKMSQDALVKMWATSNPDLRQGGKSGARRGLRDDGIILFDEAQDINPVLAQVVKAQQAQQVTVGDGNQSIYCSVLGTQVTTVTGRSTIGTELIEDLSVGDRVLAYDTGKGHMYRSGCVITGIARFRHSGEVVRVTTASGMSSAYTPKHHSIVRFGDGLRSKHAVYLMRKDGSYRIGSCRLAYRGSGAQNGIGMRMRQEKADAAWLLSLHGSRDDALLEELRMQHLFNIPGARFDGAHGQDSAVLREFWRAVGDNGKDAFECLKFHGRLMEFPLIASRGPGAHVEAGIRRAFVTATANVVDGMEVLPQDAVVTASGKALRSSWVPVSVTREAYDDDVVSLTVDKAHTYFGDGILTHNSFRGATNQLDEMSADYDLPLTQSWRFGEGVAEAGNRMLRLLRSKQRVVGSGPKSEIMQPGSMKDPEAILTRTNAGALAAAIEMLEEGRVVGVSKKQHARFKSIKDSIDWLQGDQRKEKPGNFYEDLESFDSWEEVIEEASKKNPDPVARLITKIYESVDDWDSFMEKIKVVREEGGPTLDSIKQMSERTVEIGGKLRLRQIKGGSRGRTRYAVFGNTYDHKDAIQGVRAEVKRQRIPFGPASGEPSINKGNFFWSFEADSPEQALDVVRKLDAAVTGQTDESEIDTTITTGHMSKGLEWDSVRIWNDFRPFTTRDGDPLLPKDEELRLFYVMLTRAKKRLDPGGLGVLLNRDPKRDYNIDHADEIVPIEYVGRPAAPWGDADASTLTPAELSEWLPQPQGAPASTVTPDPFQPGAPEGDTDAEGDLPDTAPGDTPGPAAGPAAGGPALAAEPVTAGAGGAAGGDAAAFWYR